MILVHVEAAKSIRSVVENPKEMHSKYVIDKRVLLKNREYFFGMKKTHGENCSMSLNLYIRGAN